jgi:hypothetical protein
MSADVTEQDTREPVVISRWVLRSGRVMPFTPDGAACVLLSELQKMYGSAVAYPLDVAPSAEPCTPGERREVVEAVVVSMFRELGIRETGK